MNKKQQSYVTAKAVYDTKMQYLEDSMKSHVTLLDTESGIDEYYNIEEQVDIQLGVTASGSAMKQAENEMIAWAKSLMQRKHPEQFNQVAFLFESRLFTIHQQLIDLLLRLEG